MKMLKNLWNEYALVLMSIMGAVIFIYIIYNIEMWKWHTFQSITHSDISFWKYALLFSK